MRAKGRVEQDSKTNYGVHCAVLVASLHDKPMMATEGCFQLFSHDPQTGLALMEYKCKLLSR